MLLGQMHRAVKSWVFIGSQRMVRPVENIFAEVVCRTACFQTSAVGQVRGQIVEKVVDFGWVDTHR